VISLALVPFLWDKFGFRYAMREWAAYTGLFLLPLAVFCTRLSGADGRADAHGDAVTVTTLAVAGMWALRHLFNEGKQLVAGGSLSNYIRDTWNVIDLLLLSLFGAVAGLFAGGDDELLVCKSAAAVLSLVAFLKAAQFFQAFPDLGRLVQVWLPPA
jgi:hypothetical protein